MRYLLCFLLLVGLCQTAVASLLSAKWGTEPQSPVYAGQEYELTLTLETLSNEEITGVQLTQGPGQPPERQTSYEKDNRRYTVLHWTLVEERPKLKAIPEGRIIANVTQVQTFGFMRTANTTRQTLRVEAFNYDVVALPGEAEGLPIGSFELQLTADRPTFSPGEVRLLTATITAKEGRIPESFAFAFEETSDGVLYPLHWVEKKERKWIAQAYFVTAAEQTITVSLKPMQSFDLGTRRVQAITAPALTLQVQRADEREIEDTTLSLTPLQSEKQGQYLRFAPSLNAPILGRLPDVWQAVETYEAWVYIRSRSLSGWIRKAELKDEQP
jgi:hypothetical protein